MTGRLKTPCLPIDKIQDAIAEHDPDWKPDKAFRDFCEHITQRRMSKIAGELQRGLSRSRRD